MISQDYQFFNSVIKRILSSKVDAKLLPKVDKLRHKVYISVSTDIFDNLAFEDWLYENSNFKEESCLLLWKNTESVVCGRHQNPWLECDVSKLMKQRMSLARRKSGGGTVYHDLGNLNCSFLTSKQRYNRKWNVNLVASVLNSKWGLNLSMNARDDILWNGFYKVSGTAAKFNSQRAYHHFTLLLDVDMTNLHQLLCNPFLCYSEDPSPHGPYEHQDWFIGCVVIGAESRATQSISSSVVNLCSVEPSITYGEVVESVAEAFIQEGLPECSSVEYLNPVDERRFPGITTLINSFKDWQWVYGKTPKFTFYRHFIHIDGDCGEISFCIHVTINKGVLENIDMQLKPTWIFPGVLEIIHQHLLSQKLSTDVFDAALISLHQTLIRNSQDKQKIADWLVQCVKVTLIGQNS